MDAAIESRSRRGIRRAAQFLHHNIVQNGRSEYFFHNRTVNDANRYARPARPRAERAPCSFMSHDRSMTVRRNDVQKILRAIPDRPNGQSFTDRTRTCRRPLTHGAWQSSC